MNLPGTIRLLASVLLSAIAAPTFATNCSDSVQTRLELAFQAAPEPRLLNAPTGDTRLVLRDKASGRVRLDTSLGGEWRCFGHDARKGRYLVGGIFQKGAWLPLGDLLYLDEASGKLQPSAFSRGDYLATAAVASPSAGYVAFIGGRDATGRLYLLDTQRDRITLLADDAPLPPPSRRNWQICHGDRFEWGGCYGDSFETLDKGILSFDDERRLTVSYGKDGPLRRANARRVRHFALPEASLPPLSLSNALAGCVEPQLQELTSSHGRLQIDVYFTLTQPIGACGCMSMRASYSLLDGDRVLAHRRFPLRESHFRTLDLGRSRDIGAAPEVRLALGCAAPD